MTTEDDGLARTDEFAAIESYGLIGDGESVALVARDGAIDWWAAPAIDSPPVFAAVLDPRDGGCFTLEPSVPYQAKRRYLPGTNVLGLTQEVQGALTWMLSCISATAPVIHPFYGLRGHVPDCETELRLRGYRDSSPVRGGNRAIDQPQWGCYGDLLECVWLAVDRAGAHLDPASADLLDALGNHVCDIWTEPDCGIWELDQRQHNTFSKAGCWVALDRLIRLSARGQVSDRDVDRWQAEQQAIRAWIDEHCWSDAKRSYVGHAGSDELDASLLLLARTGFVDGKDRRFTQTIRAIRAELADGPLLYRFSGASEIEGAFVACSFWLIDALVRNGHSRQARRLWGELIPHVSDLGLLAEEIDPATGAFLGNLPQGLSHLALLNAAAQLNGQG